MSDYRLIHAQPRHMEAVCRIIDSRIRWMDTAGIRQWNTTDYWNAYPKGYYCMRADNGELMVFADSNDTVAAVGALLREDPRWDDGLTASAYYLHHFAADLNCPGMGARMLLAMEAYTRQQGKRFLRLDCAVDNAFLNSYYAEKGYKMCGTCIDGLYEGNLREKEL